ncbi:MAG: nucleotidyltransferase family protein [Clostridia bacterium]|nr:nucleotidyltransferase family protein [Clostridia bacterium]
MNTLHSDIIKLVKSALTGEKLSLSDSFDVETAFNIAKRHSVIPMIYYGAINCGVDSANPWMQQMFFNTCTNIAYNEKQMHEIANVLKAFDENGIAYITLKGTILKSMYPKPEMRAMSDADILIKTEEHGKIAPIMLTLGYDLKVESDHEFVWRKSNVNIELHKRLIPSYNKDYYAYYGDGWRLAKLGADGKYYMSDEDQMIYTFTHFAKHYREAGIGIRHFADLWVFRNSHPNLDEEYIKTELTALQLYEFYVNILSTLAVWFEGKTEDIKTEFIAETILNSNLYGNSEKYSLAMAVKTSNSVGSSKAVRRRKFWQLVFLPYKPMCDKYPVLKKVPVLLPFMWIYRVFETLLFDKGKIKTHQQHLKQMTTENISDLKQALNFVGLDFNFKE